jgi:hypothetical protein
MIRYTARNGTTFQFDPSAADWVHVIAADDLGQSVAVDLEDLREFLQHLEDHLESQDDHPTDADLAAVGPD